MAANSVETLIAWMKVIFLTALIVLVSREFLFEPVSVHGHSMVPTFEEDDKVLLAKISRIENFDLIVFKASDDKNLIKRVIGIPGDRVEMENDQLSLNGKVIEETYLEGNKEWARVHGYPQLTQDFEAFTVPSGCYFVMGDNRLNSVDSRMFGFVLENAIVGEAKFRLAPFGRIGMVREAGM